MHAFWRRGGVRRGRDLTAPRIPNPPHEAQPLPRSIGAQVLNLGTRQNELRSTRRFRHSVRVPGGKRFLEIGKGIAARGRRVAVGRRGVMLSP